MAPVDERPSGYMFSFWGSLLLGTHGSINRFIIICVSVPPQPMMRLAKGQRRQAPRYQTQVNRRAKSAVRRVPFVGTWRRRIVDLLRWVSQRVVEALVPFTDIAVVEGPVAHSRQGLPLVGGLLPLAGVVVVDVVKGTMGRWRRRVGTLVGRLMRV